MVGLPLAVDLRILGACDLRCPFCFGPRHSLGPGPELEFRRLVGRLRVHGTRAVVVTGGEPTLVPWLDRLLHDAKAHGLETVLSTNGIAFMRRVASLAPLLDWVGLPLDGPDASSNRAMRVGPRDQFRVITELLPLLRRSYPRLGVKLGTVVTRLNARVAAKVLLALPKEALPDVWKLYEVAYSSYGGDNRSALEIDASTFDHVLLESQAIAGDLGVRLEVYRRTERVGKYLFCEPNGDAMVLTGEENEELIGNFFVDFDAILPLWSKFGDEARNEENFNRTYGPR